MEELGFAKKLAYLRKNKKITQEQLADFIGVTKASVSKWETGQSIPDVILLPRIATFFDITIDDLLGYEPQLSQEQIFKIYLDLSRDFAEGSFRETLAKSRRLVKQYYSCYPFLSQMICLWLNHWMLAETKEMQQEILQEAAKLCDRIREQSKDISLCNDAIVLNANILMLLGRPKEAIEALEASCDYARLATQSEGVLIQAYEMVGDLKKGNELSQICMYNHVFALVSCATRYLVIHQEEPKVWEETIKRIVPVIQAYNLEYLNANVTGLFYYQLAICYGQKEMEEEALEWLLCFAKCIDRLFWEEEITLRGDAYFDSLDSWFEGLELQGKAPRDKRVIYESFVTALKHPAFLPFMENKKFKEIEKIVKKRGEKI